VRSGTFLFYFAPFNPIQWPPGGGSNTMPAAWCNVLFFWSDQPSASFVTFEDNPEMPQVSPDQLNENRRHLRWLIDEADRRGGTHDASRAFRARRRLSSPEPRSPTRPW
jgi:hypothetical protein